MRILANENFPGEAVEALRDSGHDVLWIRTEAPGSDDPTVLRRAQADGRVPITFDKDFGELAFRTRQPASAGIILFRISAPSARHVANVVTTVLNGREDWEGHFSVVDDRRIRMTRLPDL